LLHNILKTGALATVWALTFVVTSAPSDAQAQQRVVYRPAYTTVPAPVYRQQPVARPATYQQAAPAAAARPATTSGDPYGFTGWLNSVRASYGLPAVGYDPNLTNWAAANNAQQAARGIGHFVMGPARRQNSAMGAYASIGGMWLASPAHRAALLDPSIRMIGIAGLGAYWTFNAY
jgi:uncharacterized protein YkwD